MRIKRRMNRRLIVASALVLSSIVIIAGCGKDSANPEPAKTVPHEGRWGIYKLNPATQDVSLIYSSDDQIFGSSLGLDSAENTILFAQKIGDTLDANYEICTVDIDGGNFTRLTNNTYMDVYPTWSPDEDSILFLSWRDTDLDIYIMNANGAGVRLFYNSGSHDGDIDWAADIVVFTTGSRIWKMNGDGADPAQVTDPPRAGEWGNANLPFGDYDPKLSPDGSKIVFERLENDISQHGNYNIFVIDSSGAGETRLTDNGYSQGLPDWSRAGDRIVYAVSAINDAGMYDLYMMNADGSNNHNVTPAYFPPLFLCHAATFAPDDAHIYFIGEWYQ